MITSRMSLKERSDDDPSDQTSDPSVFQTSGFGDRSCQSSPCSGSCGPRAPWWMRAVVSAWARGCPGGSHRDRRGTDRGMCPAYSSCIN